MEPMGLREIARVPLSERVYRTLMELIADGSIPPGAELKEQHLAKQFNVSATPVREALKRLASDGMVEIIPYRGAVVRTLNKREIDEAPAVRPWSIWRFRRPLHIWSRRTSRSYMA